MKKGIYGYCFLKFTTKGESLGKVFTKKEQHCLTYILKKMIKEKEQFYL